MHLLTSKSGRGEFEAVSVCPFLKFIENKEPTE